MKRFRGALAASLMALVALGLGSVAFVDAAEEEEYKAVIEEEMVDMKFLVEVSLGTKKDDLYSRVGVLAEDGGPIDWGNKTKVGERGKSPRVSVEGKVAVLVYVSKEKDLMYQVGSVDLETMLISWGSPASHTRGRNPSISLKGNRIVAVHQGISKDKLYIVSGVIDGKRQQITWGEQVMYDPKGRKPAVAMSKQ